MRDLVIWHYQWIVLHEKHIPHRIAALVLHPQEAEVQGGGKRLGELASRIVAEVFIGLLEADSSSFLPRKPNWKPTLPAKKAGDFTMADLLAFVGELNPVGDRQRR